MTLGFALLCYTAAGVLVASLRWPIQRRRANRQETPMRTLGVIALWPFVLPQLQDYGDAAPPLYVPAFEQRKVQIGEYLQQLRTRRDMDAKQVELLSQSYERFARYRTLSPDQRRQEAPFVVLESNRDIAHIADSRIALFEITRARRGERERETERRRHEQARDGRRILGHADVLSQGGTIVVHTNAALALMEVPEDSRPNVVAEMVRLADRVDQSRIMDARKMRTRLVMNGPLPCLLVGHAAAVVVEIEHSTIYVLGVLRNNHPS